MILSNKEYFGENSVLYSSTFLFLFFLLSTVSFSQDTTSFITTWRTIVDNEEITIPTIGPGYNYIVDWGDGSFGIDYSGDASHVYDLAGEYRVSISGDFPRIYFKESDSNDKIIFIDQWGEIKWESMVGAFSDCSKLQGRASDIPDLERVNSLSGMFSYCLLFNQDIGDWDVSNITNITNMFFNAEAFNQDLNDWDVSNVEMINGIFGVATSFNGKIGNWYFPKVKDISNMFYSASSFNQDISNWNVSNVEVMNGTFSESSFNSSLNSWDVSKVNSMSFLFARSPFNEDISNWDVSKVTDMSYMFQNSAWFNRNIGNWDVSKVIDMSFMFNNAVSFDSDISNWDVSSVLTMDNMFLGVTLSTHNYDRILSKWNSINIKDDVVFDGGFSLYCNSEEDRGELIDNSNWIITDGGKECNNPCLELRTDILCLDRVNSFLMSHSSTSCVDCPYSVITGVFESQNVILLSPPDCCCDQEGELLDCYGNLICELGGIGEGDCLIDIISQLDNMDTLWHCSMEPVECTEFVERPFITTWKVEESDLQINIPIKGGGYDYKVDWGDNTSTINNYSDASHSYQTAGEYKVSITGQFPRIRFGEKYKDGEKIISIDQWGTGRWTSMEGAFTACINLAGQANDQPNLSSVKDISSMFSGARIFNQDLSNWNVSNVEDFSFTFQSALIFDGNIDLWNVSSAKNMSSMFQGCSSFNSDISRWDVSKVEDMMNMFTSASVFNHNIVDWDVSNVVNMEGMFSGAFEFNQDIGRWDVSNVKVMQRMFYFNSVFNQDISAWDVSNVKVFFGMFAGASSFNINLSNWNMSNASDVSWMFADATSFNQNLGAWDVSNINDMSFMFAGVTLSTSNYDSILTAWNAQILQEGVRFHGGFSEYCKGEADRFEMIENSSWRFTDGGLECTNECKEITEDILCLPNINALLLQNIDEDCRDCPYEVIVGDLDGSGVILVIAPDCCCDKRGALFLCNGSKLCTIGGVPGGTCAPDILSQMMNKETIWDCNDALPECKPVSIPEVESNYRVIISPNPVVSEVEIIVNSVAFKEIKVQLIDITGKVLFSQTKLGNSIRIEKNITEIPSGIYFVKIYVEGAFMEAKKLIKM